MKVTYLVLHEGELKCPIYEDEHFDPIFVELSHENTLSIYDVYDIVSKLNPKLIITVGDSAFFNFMLGVSIAVSKLWKHIPCASAINNTLLDDLYSQVTFGSSLILPPLISIYSSTFNTMEKIMIPYKSLLNQTYPHWEWVIFDDSTKEGTWEILTNIANNDPRVRVYKGKGNSGYIGEVKKMACMLSRGDFLLELDHDDELHRQCLEWIINAAKKYPDAKFFYTDCIEMYENTRVCCSYGDSYAFGCAAHYRTIIHNWKSCEKRWITGERVSPFNHATLRYIVGIPNHARVWKRDAYMDVGGHNENMAVADDYELVLRTVLKYPSVYIREIGYLQYRNEEGNNFTFLRNSLIQRKTQITAKWYNNQIHDFLVNKGANDHSYKDILFRGHNFQLTEPEEHKNFSYHYCPSHKDNHVYVAVIIPTCNNIAELAKTVKSVFTQSYPYWNMYIVGNKCPKLDEYMEANLEMFVEQSKKNKIMYWNFGEAYGMYACKNYALRNMINEDWATYIEDGYSWEPDHLESLIQCLLHNEKNEFAFSGLRVGSIDFPCNKPDPFRTETSCLIHHVSLVRQHGYWLHPDKVPHSDVWELISQWKNASWEATNRCTVYHEKDDALIELLQM